jgi:hypothetical protein
MTEFMNGRKISAAKIKQNPMKLRRLFDRKQIETENICGQVDRNKNLN